LARAIKRAQGALAGQMIEGGSFEEPPFHFLGAFFQSSKNPFRGETIHHSHLVGFLCLTRIGGIDKESHRFVLRP
jgi:hypothetical protein